MKEASTTPAQEWKGFNRWAYGAFILLVIYGVLSGNYGDALMNLGIALIFDPFDQNVKWNDRPRYQRVWLLVHVSLVLAGFTFLLLN